MTASAGVDESNRKQKKQAQKYKEQPFRDSQEETLFCEYLEHNPPPSVGHRLIPMHFYLP